MCLGGRTGAFVLSYGAYQVPKNNSDTGAYGKGDKRGKKISASGTFL